MNVFQSYVLAISFTVLLLSCDESNNSKPDERESCESSHIELPSNSFDGDFVNTTIKYEYVKDSETHDYSGNWDLDGDNKKDSVRFVGHGGAHLYFSLVVKLSSDSKAQKIDWLSTDFPLLQPVDSLINRKGDSFLPKFVVGDFNGDGIDDIFIQLDHTIMLPEKFKELNPEHRKFVVMFDKKTGNLIVEQWRKMQSNKQRAIEGST